MELEKMSLEDAMKELEEIAQTMEKGEISMEESVGLYERGLVLAKHCREKLDGYKARINVIKDGEEQPLDAG